MWEHRRTTDPLFLTTRATASALSVSVKTVYRWLAAGTLNGVQVAQPREWHQSRLRGGSPRWRVTLASVEALLIRSYDGGKVPRSLTMRLRRLAKPSDPANQPPVPHPQSTGTPK